MTAQFFTELMDRLGGRVSSRGIYQLPFTPLDRLKNDPDASVKFSEGGAAMFEIPTEDGVALVFGKVKMEDDGTQTLTDVVAVHRPNNDPSNSWFGQ